MEETATSKIAPTARERLITEDMARALIKQLKGPGFKPYDASRLLPYIEDPNAAGIRMPCLRATMRRALRLNQLQDMLILLVQ